MTTVCIIDDEQDARELIKQYLADYPEFSLIGEAADGMEAVTVINKLRPDLVFLDVQMPGRSGFEVITELDYLPDIIFSTAYDSYALQAFTVHAVDYLLKPYGAKRFGTCITRLRSNREKVQQMAERLLLHQNQQKKVLVHHGRRQLMIDIIDIIYLEADGDYTSVHTRGEQFLITKGLGTTLSYLNGKEFIRIHRSFAVQLDKVDEIKKEGRKYYIVCSDGTQLRVSRSYLPMLKSLQP